MVCQVLGTSDENPIDIDDKDLKVHLCSIFIGPLEHRHVDSAGNNSRSSDIVRPNFENVWPHCGWT